MTETSKSEIVGHVNERRPLARLSFFGTPEPDYLLHIDTGCNKELVVFNTDWNAALIHSFGNSCRTEVGIVASGDEVTFKVYEAEIEWFGDRRDVFVHVPIPITAKAATKQPPLIDGEPVGLIGIELLSECRLELNFAAKRVRIHPR